MNITIVIILCVLIAIALILFPLIVSHKAQSLQLNAPVDELL